MIAKIKDYASIIVICIIIFVVFYSGWYSSCLINKRQTITVERIITNDIIRWRTNTVKIAIGTNTIIDTRYDIGISVTDNTAASKWASLTNDTIPRMLSVIKYTNDDTISYAYAYRLYDPDDGHEVHGLNFTNSSQSKISTNLSLPLWNYAIVGCVCLLAGGIGGVIIAK